MFKKIIVSVILIVVLIVVSACSNATSFIKGCPNGSISWVDILMVNDVKYTGYVDMDEVDDIEKGEVIGEVTFTLSDHACSDHRLRNGDAAYLPVGTEIYEYVGFDPSFRVIANGQIYQVDKNPSAQTIADLYDIEGKVEKISLVSAHDNSHIADFSTADTEAFIEEYLTLDYVQRSNGNGGLTGERAFIRFHLTDGSSFIVSYWIETNVVNPGGPATDLMHEIVTNKKEVASAN